MAGRSEPTFGRGSIVRVPRVRESRPRFSGDSGNARERVPGTLLVAVSTGDAPSLIRVNGELGAVASWTDRCSRSLRFRSSADDLPHLQTRNPDRLRGIRCTRSPPGRTSPSQVWPLSRLIIRRRQTLNPHDQPQDEASAPNEHDRCQRHETARALGRRCVSPRFFEGTTALTLDAVLSGAALAQSRPTTLSSNSAKGAKTMSTITTQRRRRHLLQGLGPEKRPTDRFPSRLAAERRRLGRSDALFRGQGLPRHRS